jgi:hypothetical protein
MTLNPCDFQFLPKFLFEIVVDESLRAKLRFSNKTNSNKGGGWIGGKWHHRRSVEVEWVPLWSSQEGSKCYIMYVRADFD